MVEDLDYNVHLVNDNIKKYVALKHCLVKTPR